MWTQIRQSGVYKFRLTYLKKSSIWVYIQGFFESTSSKFQDRYIPISRHTMFDIIAEEISSLGQRALKQNSSGCCAQYFSLSQVNITWLTCHLVTTLSSECNPSQSLWTDASVIPSKVEAKCNLVCWIHARVRFVPSWNECLQVKIRYCKG